MAIREHYVEQQSQEWFDLRKGRVGGSESDRMNTPAKAKTLMIEKLAEILSSQEDEYYTSASAEHGLEYEGAAAFAFEMETGRTTSLVGYVTNDNYRHAGLSPDRRTSDSGYLEIKCPQPKAHISMILNNAPEKKYMEQILHYFMVDDRAEVVHFISYCPMVDSRKMLVLEFKREDLTNAIEKKVAEYKKFEKSLEKGLELFK